MTKFTNRKEIRYVCGNRLGFHIFIISACSRNVKYILTKIRSCARQLFARCRGADSRARRCTCDLVQAAVKMVNAPDLSLRGGQRPTWRPEREARGSALGVQSREGSCDFAGRLPRYRDWVLRDCHVASLLAMTRQAGAAVHQCPCAVELPLYKALTTRKGHAASVRRQSRQRLRSERRYRRNRSRAVLTAALYGTGSAFPRLPRAQSALAMTNRWPFTVLSSACNTNRQHSAGSGMPLPYNARPEVCVFFILHFSVFRIHFHAPLPYNARTETFHFHPALPLHITLQISSFYGKSTKIRGGTRNVR